MYSSAQSQSSETFCGKAGFFSYRLTQIYYKSHKNHYNINITLQCSVLDWMVCNVSFTKIQLKRKIIDFPTWRFLSITLNKHICLFTSIDKYIDAWLVQLSSLVRWRDGTENSQFSFPKIVLWQNIAMNIICKYFWWKSYKIAQLFTNGFKLDFQFARTSFQWLSYRRKAFANHFLEWLRELEDWNCWHDFQMSFAETEINNNIEVLLLHICFRWEVGLVGRFYFM